MERGLIVVIGGVDDVDKCLEPACGARSGWGRRGGRSVDDAPGLVGESHESPGRTVPAHGVHMLVRRGVWVTLP